RAGGDGRRRAGGRGAGRGDGGAGRRRGAGGTPGRRAGVAGRGGLGGGRGRPGGGLGRPAGRLARGLPAGDGAGLGHRLHLGPGLLDLLDELVGPVAHVPDGVRPVEVVCLAGHLVGGVEVGGPLGVVGGLLVEEVLGLLV